MALLTIDSSLRFNIMPETAAWAYSMYIKSFDTYGGRVVQLLSCNIDSLSVEGYIRQKKTGIDVPDAPYVGYNIDQWQGLREFEYNVKNVMAYHEQVKKPVRFEFPEVGWDGWVFLTGYSDVRYEVGTSAVRYRLSFDIDSGFDSIRESASSQGLENVPNGVGWVRSIYNTPNVGDWRNAKKVIEKIVDDAGSFTASNPMDFYQYLMEVMNGESDEEEEKVVSDVAESMTTIKKTKTALGADSKYTSDEVASIDDLRVTSKNPLVALGLIPEGSIWGWVE